MLLEVPPDVTKKIDNTERFLTAWNTYYELYRSVEEKLVKEKTEHPPTIKDFRHPPDIKIPKHLKNKVYFDRSRYVIKPKGRVSLSKKEKAEVRNLWWEAWVEHMNKEYSKVLRELDTTWAVIRKGLQGTGLENEGELRFRYRSFTSKYLMPAAAFVVRDVVDCLSCLGLLGSSTYENRYAEEFHETSYNPEFFYQKLKKEVEGSLQKAPSQTGGVTRRGITFAKEFYTADEIAKIHEISDRTFYKYLKNMKGFPKPIDPRAGTNRVWSREAVKKIGLLIKKEKEENRRKRKKKIIKKRKKEVKKTSLAKAKKQTRKKQPKGKRRRKK